MSKKCLTRAERVFFRGVVGAAPPISPSWHVGIGPALAVAFCLATGATDAATTLAVRTQASATSVWEVGTGDIRVRCPLTVGGSFEATTTTIEGSLRQDSTNSALIEGQISVRLAELDTGIGLRNTHLSETYLEVQRGEGFAEAVLSEVELELAMPSGDGRHDTDFTATLQLHGMSRPVAGEVELRRSGSTLDIEASFSVSIQDYGIARPRYLGVGVRDEVEVTVTFRAQSTETE